MKKLKEVIPYVFFIVGIVSIIVGICFLVNGCSNDTFYGSPDTYQGAIGSLGRRTYGADFYTDVYKAAAFAGNACAQIYFTLNYGFGAFFIITGILEVICFIKGGNEHGRREEEN